VNAAQKVLFINGQHPGIPRARTVAERTCAQRLPSRQRILPLLAMLIALPPIGLFYDLHQTILDDIKTIPSPLFDDDLGIVYIFPNTPVSCFFHPR